MSRILSVAAISAALLSSSALAADAMPRTGPAPAWVKPVAIPAADPAKKEAPLQILTLTAQTRFSPAGQTSYVEYVMLPQTVAGLQGTGTVSLPWNVARSDLTINAIQILRGTETIDLLKNADFTILRREGGLEKSARLDGVRTVVLPAKGLQIGDRLRVAASYVVKNGKIGTGLDEISSFSAPFDVALVERRFLVAPGTDIRFKTIGTVPKPIVVTNAEGTDYRFAQSHYAPPEYPSAMRLRDKTNDIQFSGYHDWAEVAQSSIAPYAEARKIDPASPLAAEADKIAAATKDPKRRMLAALRLTQEQVRYVALVLGEGAYMPTAAGETWSQKFGDCKAKSALLLGLLDRLGIAAEAMYVSSSKGEMLGERLPSLDTFDHVIVRAVIDQKAYFLDATDYGQRTVAEVAGSTLGYGLPINAQAQLLKLPAMVVSAPGRESELVWDGSQGVAGTLPYTAKLTLRGVVASEMRLKKASADKPEDFEKDLKNLMPGVGNDDLKIVSQTDDEASGDYIVAFAGKAKVDWSEFEGMKGYRFAFSNNAANWTEKFERKEGPFKDAAVILNPRFWQREIETIVVPAASKPFALDVTPLDQTVAATHIWRTVKIAGTRITSVTDFQRVGEEMTADEARKAEDTLGKIAEQWAYVVAPRGFRPPAEAKVKIEKK